MKASRKNSAERPFRFRPVPRRGNRRDGWTSDRQHAFVWALARIPSITAAARGVGMTPSSAHRLRNSPGAEDFARAWDTAWQMGMDTLVETAIDRGMNGQERPIVYRGQVVGKVHSYDNRMLMRTLLLCDRMEEKHRAAAKRARHE